MEPVSEVLRARAQADGGIESMVMLSLVAHGAILAGLVLMAPGWRGARAVPRQVMTISLSGSPGPATGGMTPIAARPIQQVVEQPQPRQPVRPPAAKAPEMTLPGPNTRAQPSTSTPASSARGRTPTTGGQVQPGTAVAETGAKGAGFGLASGGGAGTGAYLDVGNFCCQEYLETMQQLIRNNWNWKQQVVGKVMVKFTILRDGAITSIELERSSGYTDLDLESQRALARARQLPPLPAQFPDTKLTVHVEFQYQR